MTLRASDSQSRAQKQIQDWWGWKALIAASIAFGAILLILFGAQTDNPWRSIGGGGLVALAAMSVGAIVGFLFGLPRSPRDEPDSDPAAALSGRSEKTGPTLRYRPNSNLDDISDWLTKILVGLGLTQLGAIPDYATKFGNFTQGIFGGAGGSPAAAVGLAVSFFGGGFFFAYLWARMRLGAALAMADAEQVQHEAARAKQVAGDAAERSVRAEGVIEQLQSRLSQYTSQVAGSFSAAAVLKEPSRDELEQRLRDGWERLSRNQAFASLTKDDLPTHPDLSTRSPRDLPAARRWLDRNESELNALRPLMLQVESSDSVTPSDLEIRDAIDRVRKLEAAYAAEVAGRHSGQ